MEAFDRMCGLFHQIGFEMWIAKPLYNGVFRSKDCDTTPTMLRSDSYYLLLTPFFEFSP